MNMDANRKFSFHLEDKHEQKKLVCLVLASGVFLVCLIGTILINSSAVSTPQNNSPTKKKNGSDLDSKIWRHDASGRSCPLWLACVVGFNEICTEHDVCIGNLKCVGPTPDQMRCQCSNPDHQILNNVISNKHICRGLVGSPCDPTKGTSSQLCVESAECVKVEGQSYRCECRKGHVENRERGCDIAYGYACGNIRKINNTTPCDRAANLVCNKGMCECKNENDVYETARRQCSIPVGISCHQHQDCVENAFCKKVDTSTDLKNNWGRCACKRNRIVDPKNPKVCTLR